MKFFVLIVLLICLACIDRGVEDPRDALIYALDAKNAVLSFNLARCEERVDVRLAKGK